MKNLKILISLILVSLIFTGCTKEKNILAEVNGQKITRQQFDKAIDEIANNPMLIQQGVNFKKDDTNPLYLVIKGRTMEELVVKTLINQEIEKQHIKVTKEDLEEEYKTIIDRIGSKEKFDELLKQSGISQSQFKSDLADEVKHKKLVSRLGVIAVSDSDVEKFYKTNLDKFHEPEKVRASHILISASKDQIKDSIVSNEANKSLAAKEIDELVKKGMQEKYVAAEALLAELKKDLSQFEKIAKEKSDDTASAKLGGDLGYFAHQDMVAPFSKAAFALKPNNVSGIVETLYGYHIILVKDKVKAGIVPLDKVKAEVKNFLENQQKVEVLKKFVETAKKNAEIKYMDESFDPENIQKALRESAMKNPALMESHPGAAPAKK